ncbi:hypothetical protein NDK50_11010 [Paraburkholderia bryophila]|uniref:hypothetical protein n=1 Tax=Paraburkholderia bryophila TaxID=420952 RepID=UPI00234A4C9B|nr:hypothetical protein [Paraburkholderia bryophila]WCM18019.1 hypothetical protein NDK50_11010 [Paraburkholderia bryophila]
MAVKTFGEAIGDVTAFVTGVSVSAADATNSAQQAVAAKALREKIISTAISANDLFGVVAGGMQRLIGEFSLTSAEAEKLLGKAGIFSAGIGMALASIPITDAVLKGESGKITTGQLDALSGAALLAGAVVLPEAAVLLTVVGSLMVAAAVFDSSEANTLSNAVAQLKRLIQPYYSQLPPSSQSTFKSTMADAMAATLSGGMLIPKVNDSGWVISYGAEEPTNVAHNGSGTHYSFDSGVTYVIGHVIDDDPLSASSDVSGKSVWTLPSENLGTPLTLDIHAGGTYTSRFIDPAGHAVTEIYIAGSSATYSVTAPADEFRFIYVAGNDNRIVVHGDRNQVSLAEGNRLTIDGADNIVHARANTTVEFGPKDGNVISNEVTGGKLTVAGGGIEVTNALNEGCGGEQVTVGTVNRLRINADGSKTLTLRYDGNDRVYQRTYNAAGVQIELLIVSPNGSYADSLFDPVTGLAISLTTAGTDGSGMVFKYNAAQQLVEQDYIRISEPGWQFLKDPLTGETTAFNSISGGWLPAVHYDPSTDMVTWTARGVGAIRAESVGVL